MSLHIESPGLITIILIILKLTHIINWSWLWILSPMWLPFAIVLFIFAMIGLIVGIVWTLTSIFKGL